MFWNTSFSIATLAIISKYYLQYDNICTCTYTRTCVLSNLDEEFPRSIYISTRKSTSTRTAYILLRSVRSTTTSTAKPSTSTSFHPYYRPSLPAAAALPVHYKLFVQLPVSHVSLSSICNLHHVAKINLFRQKSYPSWPNALCAGSRCQYSWKLLLCHRKKIYGLHIIENKKTLLLTHTSEWYAHASTVHMRVGYPA